MTSEEARAKIDELKNLIHEVNKGLGMIGTTGTEQDRVRMRQIQTVLNETAGMISTLEGMLEFLEEMDAEVIFWDKNKDESHQPESSSGNA